VHPGNAEDGVDAMRCEQLGQIAAQRSC
jgi:hypothetical protein